MNVPVNRIGEMARAYWQPLVLCLIVLLLFSQAYSWGMSAIEIHKISNLIEDADKKQDEKPKEGQAPKSPPPPAQPPKNIFKQEQAQYKLSAIFMDTACINGQYLKSGAKVGKVTLTEIGMSHVVLDEGEGKTKTIQLFQGGGGGGGPQPGIHPGGGMSRPPRSSHSSSKKKQSTTNRSSSKSALPPPGPPSGFSIRGMTMETFNSLPSSEKKAFGESLSEVEKKQFGRQMRNSRVGGGPRVGGAIRVR